VWRQNLNLNVGDEVQFAEPRQVWFKVIWQGARPAMPDGRDTAGGPLAILAVAHNGRWLDADEGSVVAKRSASPQDGILLVSRTGTARIDGAWQPAFLESHNAHTFTVIPIPNAELGSQARRVEIKAGDWRPKEDAVVLA